MKHYGLLILGMVFCNFVFGIDVVNLTNGDVLRGEVIEQNNQEGYIQMRFEDGNERRIKSSLIKGIKKENLSKSFRQTRPGKVLITAGGLILAGSYGATIGLASGDAGKPFIPVIGPFLMLERTNAPALCIVSGVLQSAGLVMLITGLIINAGTDNTSTVGFSPVLTPDLTGVSLAYRF